MGATGAAALARGLSRTGDLLSGRPWLPLVPLTAAVMVLAAAGVLPAWPGLVHLVALPPLDLFGDLRVLLTTTSGPVSFTVLLAVVLIVRITVMALLMGGLTRQRLALAAAFYLLLAPLLLLAAQVVYIANTLLYSRLFWAGMVAVVVLGFLFGPVPWRARAEEADPGSGPFALARHALARTWREGLRVDVMPAYAVAVTAVGVLAQTVPALAVPLVAVSAAATAVTIAALSRPAPSRPLLRLGAAVVALVVVGSLWITTRGIDLPEPAPRREGSIMVMSGINSRSGHGDMFGTRTDLLGYDCEQTFYFSYAGPGDGQPRGQARCPLRTGAPYVPEDTQRPVGEQVEVFAQQVRGLPRPLVVAGHSHGAWIAWKAVATGAAPQVDVLVLAGPFPESASGYRPLGEEGPGRPASDLLHLLVPLAAYVDFDFDTDAPAAYELLGTTSTPADIFALQLPEHVRAVSLTSSSDLPLKPSGWRMDTVDRDVCPLRTPHAYIPSTPAYYEEVRRFLDGAPPMDCPVYRDWGIPMTLPFSVPELDVAPLDEDPVPTG